MAWRHFFEKILWWLMLGEHASFPCVSQPLNARHYSPVWSQFYPIFRQCRREIFWSFRRKLHATLMLRAESAHTFKHACRWPPRLKAPSKRVWMSWTACAVMPSYMMNVANPRPASRICTSKFNSVKFRTLFRSFSGITTPSLRWPTKSKSKNQTVQFRLVFRSIYSH
jgi:hypothetical protein